MTVTIDEPDEFAIVLRCTKCRKKKLLSCTAGFTNPLGVTFTKDDVAWAKKHLSGWTDWQCDNCLESSDE